MRHEAVAMVEHVGFAEEETRPHLDHLSDSPKLTFNRGPDEVDLELDRGVPHPVLLERGQRHTHRGVGDLRDHPALDDAAAVPVFGACYKLHDHAARLRLADSCTKRLHPAIRFRRQQGLCPPDIPQGPRRLRLQFLTVVFCFAAAAMASATSLSSSLETSSPDSRLRSAMIRSRTRAASSN